MKTSINTWTGEKRVMVTSTEAIMECEWIITTKFSNESKSAKTLLRRVVFGVIIANILIWQPENSVYFNTLLWYRVTSQIKVFSHYCICQCISVLWNFVDILFSIDQNSVLQLFQNTKIYLPRKKTNYHHWKSNQWRKFKSWTKYL